MKNSDWKRKFTMTNMKFYEIWPDFVKNQIPANMNNS